MDSFKNTEATQIHPIHSINLEVKFAKYGLAIPPEGMTSNKEYQILEEIKTKGGDLIYVIKDDNNKIQSLSAMYFDAEPLTPNIEQDDYHIPKIIEKTVAEIKQKAKQDTKLLVFDSANKDHNSIKHKVKSIIEEIKASLHKLKSLELEMETNDNGWIKITEKIEKAEKNSQKGTSSEGSGS